MASLENSLVKPISIVCILGVTTLAVWTFVLLPEFEKMSHDFEFYMEYIGEDQVAESANGELSEPFRLIEVLHQKVTNVDGNILTVSSNIEGQRADTGEVVFDLTNEFLVDKYSMVHADMDGLLFAFKEGVEKRNYDFFHPLVFDEATLIYQGTDIIHGLEVYVFTAENKNNDVSEAFPQYSPHTIHSDTKSTLWVEPITGDLLRFEKHWDDYTIEEGVRVNTVEIGWKKTSEFSEFILSQTTKSRIDYENLYHYTIPIMILGFYPSVGVVLILRKRLADAKTEIMKQEKLATIGHLSARVAHDLRNPLSVIMNVTDLDTKVPAKTPEQSEKRKEMIVRACERMSHQINRVMDFVKLKPLELEIGSVKTIFDSVVHSIVVPEDVKIIYKGDIPEICCDPKVMEALFANLFSNSIQAMEKKGVITVNVINEKNKVIINVQDQGPGIQKQNIDKIFEPLFTTKQEGTGLGLASCKNMVEQHGGTISVTNNPTTFTITLPKIIPLVGEKNVRKSNRN